jgi:three-Cys-motif partner protein
MAGSKFGGDWTKQKLLVIEEYLKKYATVMKNCNVKKIYVDAFAGSGKTEIKENVDIENLQTELFDIGGISKDSKFLKPTISVLDGSAILSLKYDFDKYYFIELDEERLTELEIRIKNEHPQKIGSICFINGNCNEELKGLMSNISVCDRCLMFLDPYALELEWSTLEAISKKGVIDLWYLFPFSALTRSIPKDGSKLDRTEKIINLILGTEDLKTTLYEATGQNDLWKEEEFKRKEYDKLITFIMGRFKELFPYVFDEPIILRNGKKRAPLFLLSFMMTNDSTSAINLASRIVKGIKKKLDRLYGNN